MKPGRMSNSQDVSGVSALGIRKRRDAALAGADATAGMV